MARFCPLFSSSKGNCIYMGCANAGLLVDAGVAARTTFQALEQQSIDKNEIKAILITHSHTDHVAGLSRISKKLNIPLIMSCETAASLTESGIVDETSQIIDADAMKITVGDMTITSFETSHDCKGSRGYRVTMPDGNSIAVCTDLGYVSESVREAITGCQLVMIESNHDITMLQKGPYPPVLKHRILSDCGHLSNSSCAAELPSLVKTGTTRIVLGHLSQDNNLPSAAATCAKAALMEHGFVENSDYILYVAPVKGGKMLTL